MDSIKLKKLIKNKEKFKILVLEICLEKANSDKFLKLSINIVNSRHK
jgi:hypothetical protein